MYYYCTHIKVTTDDIYKGTECSSPPVYNHSLVSQLVHIHSSCKGIPALISRMATSRFVLTNNTSLHPTTAEIANAGYLVLQCLDEIGCSTGFCREEKRYLIHNLRNILQILWKLRNSERCTFQFSNTTGYILNPPPESLKHVIGVGHRRLAELQTLYKCHIFVPDKNQKLPIIVHSYNLKDVKMCTYKIIDIITAHS